MLPRRLRLRLALADGTGCLQGGQTVFEIQQRCCQAPVLDLEDLVEGVSGPDPVEGIQVVHIFRPKIAPEPFLLGAALGGHHLVECGHELIDVVATFNDGRAIEEFLEIDNNTETTSLLSAVMPPSNGEMGRTDQADQAGEEKGSHINLDGSDRCLAVIPSLSVWVQG